MGVIFQVLHDPLHVCQLLFIYLEKLLAKVLALERLDMPRIEYLLDNKPVGDRTSEKKKKEEKKKWSLT